ncbi:MAG: hypothetical protein OER77_06365 [Myxococcales bacterium]|nr:hypothetical protein [Myxococcales bacterium]
MSFRRGAGLSFVLFVTLGVSSPVGAWTRTVVKSADAMVEVDPDASMSVLLKLDVQVHAGWLHELELAGAGADVELDRRRPPYLYSKDGEVYRPEAEITEDGLIRLSFERRGAPRKGEYRVVLRYRTQEEARPLDGTGSDRIRLTWTLPAWETGLHDVSVDIRAPRGASVPYELQDQGPGVELNVADRRNVTQLEWRRIHLPRHTPWKLTFDVPTSTVTLPPATPEEPTPAGFRPLDVEEHHPLPWAVALLACLALLKRRSIEVRVGAESLIVRTSWAVVLAAAAGLLALSGWLAPNDIICAIPLVALALHRPTKPSTLPLDRDWQPTAPDRNARQKLLPTDLLDGTTAIGLVVLGASFAVAILLEQPFAAIFLLLIFFTGTRQHSVPTAEESDEKLRTFISDLRLPPEAPPMSFRWETCEQGAPRCRIFLPAERAGLLSLGFVVTARMIGFVARRKVMLLVETRTQSDADDLARRRIRVEPDFRSTEGRIGRLVDWEPDTMSLIRAFGCQTPTKPVKASEGTWLLREITESQREAA